MTDDNVALPLVQTSWIVPDIEQAARGWVAMGVGPFFVFDVDLPEAKYRGQTVPLSFTVALAQAGGTQIELICQTSTGPSAYRDVVPEGATGFHHVCRAFGAYDETYAKLRKQGIEIATEFELAGARACYADTRELLGCMLELVDESETGTKLIALVRDAANGWDGSDPIRKLALV